MSAIQTQVITECLHEADLSKGVFNIVTGYGNVVGAALTANRDVSKITFTGSTVTGRAIAQMAATTMKRVTMELGGKSPSIILTMPISKLRFLRFWLPASSIADRPALPGAASLFLNIVATRSRHA